MNKPIKDTYFFNSRIALETAKRRNIITTDNNSKIDYRVYSYHIEQQKRMTFYKDIQTCYYYGEKLVNEPDNLIHLPIENLFEFFMNNNLRFPEVINFDESPLSEQERDFILKSFINIYIKIRQEKDQKSIFYKNVILHNKPNFEDKVYRVFLIANRHTSVMNHISKDIANTFRDLGYEVLLSLEKSAIEQYDISSHYENFAKFNPHITININHINNFYLNEQVFNFIWFQDAQGEIMKDEKIHLRKRDFFFHLIPFIKQRLTIHKIKSKKQNFCINTDIYKNRPSIKRENKIVFIGSSYFDRVKDQTSKKIAKVLTKEYLKKGFISCKFKHSIAKEFNTTYHAIHYIEGFVLRDIPLIELCKMNLSYKIEIYGWGWDLHKETLPYYKGSLTYGENISKVYNSAKYCLVTGGYIYQQRTLEGIASGSIPIVYDSTDNYKNQKIRKNCFILFKVPTDIIKNMENINIDFKEHKKVIKKYSYINFAKKIINITQEYKND